MANVIIIPETPQRVIIRDEATTRTVRVVAQGPQGPVGDVNPQMFTLRDEAQAAATAASSEAAASSASATTASTKAGEAIVSAGNAATSAVLAQDWAIKTASPVSGAEYSSKYHAQAASASAGSASSSATAAAASATTASTRASEASTSATNAVASATAAATSATNTANALVGERSAVATLTNKTITSPVIDSGAANGVAYLNGSKVLTAGSALTFDGNTFTSRALVAATPAGRFAHTGDVPDGAVLIGDLGTPASITSLYLRSTTKANINIASGAVLAFNASGDGSGELMRLTSTGLGIGTSSPAYKLDVLGNARIQSANYADAVLRIAQGPATTGNASQILFQDQGDNTTATISAFGVAFGSGLNGALRIGTVGGSAILDASGNLGLGVVPSVWLSQFKAIDVGSGAAYAGTDTTARVFGNSYCDTGFTYRYKVAGSASYYYCGDGIHQWSAAPSGTAGDPISFTQAMTLDANGYLGIGTSSPARPLDVNGSARLYDGAALEWGGTSAGINGSSTNNYVVIATASTERLRVDAAGNLGLGVVPSAWFSTWRGLQIGASGALASRSDVFGTILFNNALINATGDSAYIGTGAASQYGLIGNEHRWYTAPSGTAGSSISFTQAMTLDASGRLGIGTSSPGDTLQIGVNSYDTGFAFPRESIYANAIDSDYLSAYNIGGSNNNGMALLVANAGRNGTAGTVRLAIGLDAPDGAAVTAAIGTASNHPLSFGTNSVERMRLDSSGNLGLGAIPFAWGGSLKSVEVVNGSFAASTGGAYVAFNCHYDGALWRYKTTGNAPAYYAAEQGVHQWWIAPSGTAGQPISFTQSMTLDAGGRLLIGKTASSSDGVIQVEGGVAHSSGFVATASFKSESGLNEKGILIGYNSLDTSSVIASGYANGAGALSFWTHNGEDWGQRMRLDASGHLIVGALGELNRATSGFLSPIGGQAQTPVRVANFGVSGTLNTSYNGQFRWFTSTGNGSVFRDGYRLLLRSSDEASGESADLFSISGYGNLTVGDGGYDNARLVIKRDAASVGVYDSASIVLRNRSQDINGGIMGGIFADTYRDVADPHYAAGIWFTRKSASGNLSSSSDIVFGAMASNNPGEMPTERMRLDASGNLGLGVVPSAWRSGHKAIEAAYGSFSSADDATTRVGLNAYLAAAGWVNRNGGNSLMFELVNGGGFQWQIAPFAAAGSTPSFTQAMTLDASGNLLVGKTAQSSGGKLEVAGNVVCQPSAAAPTLAVNGEMSFQLVSNTSLKILVRGSDGVTRSATLTLT